MDPKQLLEGEWCDSETAMRKLGIARRTLNTWAEKGYLVFKTVQNGSHRVRLYDTAVIEKLRKEGRPTAKRLVSDEVIDVKRNTVKKSAEAPKSMALVRREPEVKLGQALDTVSLFGQMLVAQKAEREQFAHSLQSASRNLENVVQMILTAQKAESDANRERLKAEREDARERWEMERKETRERWELERQDRLDRRQLRTAPPAAAQHRKRSRG